MLSMFEGANGFGVALMLAALIYMPGCAAYELYSLIADENKISLNELYRFCSGEISTDSNTGAQWCEFKLTEYKEYKDER